MRKSHSRKSLHSLDSLLNHRFAPVADSLQSAPHETTNCLKLPLFIANTIFWLLGLAMCGIGVYAWVEKDTFQNIGKLLSQRTLFFDPAFIFVIGGCLIFSVAFIGCIGALRENQCFLLLYTLILSLIFMSQMAIVIYTIVNRESTNDHLSRKLVDLLRRYRDDDDFHDLVDWIQQDWLMCCGVNGYKDWEINAYFNCSSIIIGNVEACSVPASCCKSKTYNLPDINVDNISKTKVQFNKQCGLGALKPNADLSDINVEGCLSKAYFWIVNHSTNLALIISVLLLTQIISITLALGLRSSIACKNQWKKLYLD
ncbi:hypothetical protein GJ496_000670 [Pomphorhynchus laevis]|nr:hypothetical protein GJ496_000670 [Pomphorhynchus laevis]